MSTDLNGPESDKPLTDQEGQMFAAQPIWERNRKRKGFGGRKTASAAPMPPISPEPRTFAAERDYEEPMALDHPIDTPTDAPLDAPTAATPARDYPRSEYATMNPGTTTNSTLAADTEKDAGLVTPIAHASTARATRPAKSSSVAPAAIAAAVVGLGALGAAGWYLSRDTSGVPELAAGSPETSSELAAAPLTPIDPPAQVGVNQTPPAPVATASAAPPRATVPVPQRTAAARARPAPAARSASETGVNASASASTTAVLPDGPQPYSSLSPTTTTPTPPTQVNPPLVTLPPSSEAPAAVPATPPTLPQEPPATEAPKPSPSPPT